MAEQNVKSIFRPSLFWDAEDIDISKHSAYIISRILDYGDIDDVKKLLSLYSYQEIEEVIRTRRGLFPKTGKYWAVKLKIPLEEVACLKKYYPNRQ